MADDKQFRTQADALCDGPMEIAMPGLDIRIEFINTSDKPLPFAVKLVGRQLLK